MEFEHKTAVIDIETSGLVPKKRVPGKRPGTTKQAELDYETEFEQFPFIVSIAWAVNDEEVKEYILNPEGCEIPTEASDIHGVTTEIANDSIHMFSDVILEFIKDCEGSEIVVGHGIYFDTSIIKANVMKKAQKDEMFFHVFEVITELLHKYKRIDTMRSTIKMMGKWPTLPELHMKIFRKGFKAHSAKEDVEACRSCYKWLLKKGIVPTFEQLQEKAAEKIQKES